MKNKLYERVLPTDRWAARVVSPIDIRKTLDEEKDGRVVVVHPGWGKAPERHAELLRKLANNGFLPLGVDTRYAYADQQQPRTRVLTQAISVGVTNPYFKTTNKADNRWQYRRPTVLIDICRRLEIEKRSYIGHSDGGRIAVLAVVAQPEMIDNLVIVNAAGTGNSSKGGKRLIKSNLNRVKEFAADPDRFTGTASSGFGSVFYAVTHVRRTIAEKKVIQNTDTWNLIDQLQDHPIDITVLHAKDDELISFEDSSSQAATRPEVNFVPLNGGHSNVYEDFVQTSIIEALQN